MAEDIGQQEELITIRGNRYKYRAMYYLRTLDDESLALLMSEFVKPTTVLFVMKDHDEGEPNLIASTITDTCMGVLLPVGPVSDMSNCCIYINNLDRVDIIKAQIESEHTKQMDIAGRINYQRRQHGN